MTRITASEPVQLFWTGGWDSTFRLLQLLLLSDHVVQPHYVIDSGRRSTDIELRTMEDLRRTLAEEYPAAGGRSANGAPCGTCAPCRFTAEERLGHRLPLAARLRAQVRRLGRNR